MPHVSFVTTPSCVLLSAEKLNLLCDNSCFSFAIHWAGYFLHFCMGRARMEPLRRSVCAPLGWLGRHSLGIYLLHQPVIYGGLLLLFHVFEQ